MATAGKHWKHPAVRALVTTEPVVRAELLVDIKGKFTKWKAGQIVKAQRIGRGQYKIERLIWRKPYLPLTNCFAGVPKTALKLL